MTILLFLYYILHFLHLYILRTHAHVEMQKFRYISTTIKSRLALGDISIETWLDTIIHSYQKQYRELIEEKEQD